MAMSVLGVKTNYRVVVDVEIKYEDDSSVKVSIQEGDIINLSYIKNLALVNAEGRISRLTGDSMVVDISTKYECALINVSLDDVRELSIVKEIIIPEGHISESTTLSGSIETYI